LYAQAAGDGAGSVQTYNHAMDLKPFLDIASSDHKHLCPRQVLGVRIALKGMALLGFETSTRNKHLLVISEADGCFVDGLIAVTQCTVGHRSLRLEDYGKIAATFVNKQTGRAVRVAPTLDIRERANEYAPQEIRHYFAQLGAYQIMPDEVMLTVQDVTLNIPIAQIISRSGTRVNCDRCGEEIVNERYVIIEEKRCCISCAEGGYYHVQKESILPDGF
jgi:formylmethanofuran dehydrogenase subunit E